MKKIFYLFLVFNLFIISACNSSGGSGETAVTNTITVQGESIVYVNNTSQYTATLNPANFTTESVVWSSDNDTVGTIDNNTGLFTATAQGTVNITASAGGVKSAPFNVIVAIKPDTVIIDSKSPTEVKAGEPVQFSYSVTPDNIEYKEVIWNVDNTTIANIDKNTGILIGNIAGTINVTVTVNGVTSAPYPITVILPVESVTISGPDKVSTLSKNIYNFTANPEGSTATNVVWSVDDTTFATINASTGELTTKNTAGQVTISVDVDGKTSSKMINIDKILYIYGGNLTSIGGQITLSAVNNTTSNLTWTSSAPAVATVENGVVKGVSAGSTDITVSENGNSATITVTIKDVPNGYEIDDTGAYHVYNTSGFNAWRAAITSTSSPNCYLYSDLDFTTSSPSTIDAYRGTFEGNGHIIKNYTITGNKGFISSLVGGKIANVTFDNANVTYTYSGLAFVNTEIGMITSSISNESIIENVHVTNSTLTANNNGAGNMVGIIAAGSTGGTIKNCSVTNSMITTNNMVGNIGGIIGIISMGNQAGATVSGCFVENLTITTDGGKFKDNGMGSIVGRQSSDIVDAIIGCGAVNTTITNNGQGYVGGIAGYMNDDAHASYFYGTLSSSGAGTGLDFGYFNTTNGTASANFVKKQNGTVDTITNQNSTTLVDDDTVTWTDAVNSMNQYLTDNGYTDFSFRYDETKGYPVIDYAK